MGYISDEVAAHLRLADFIVLESNYDSEMLEKGPYPVHLKKRIAADTGHLSNDQTGVYLSENYSTRLQHIFLCHLSRENNLPNLAYTTIQNHLENKQIIVGKDVQLITLDRLVPSEIYIF